MKNILYVVFLLPILTYGQTESVDTVGFFDIQEKADHLIYKGNSDKPFTGVCRINDRNGQKQLLGKIINGKKEGLWTEWREGQKRSERNFVNGKAEGLWTAWYNNSQKQEEGKFLNDKKEGLWTEWRENGPKAVETNFVNGKEEGLLTAWYENGQKAAVGNFKDGEKEGLWTEWDENGKERVKKMEKRVTVPQEDIAIEETAPVDETLVDTVSMVISEPAYSAPVLLYPSVDFGYGLSTTSSVKVEKQEWVTQNLNVDRFANGDPIPEARTADEWTRAGENKQPAWCYFNNYPANGRTYGRLYNWYAVNDPRGLVPKGWHVPSDAEWTAITSYLGGEATAGTSLKSTYGWVNNGNGNNISGIAGLPGGYRVTSGTFLNLGKNGNWWSSSEDTTGEAWYRFLNYGNGGAFRDSSDKSCGFSVRCLRD